MNAQCDGNTDQGSISEKKNSQGSQEESWNSFDCFQQSLLFVFGIIKVSGQLKFEERCLPVIWTDAVWSGYKVARFLEIHIVWNLLELVEEVDSSTGMKSSYGDTFLSKNQNPEIWKPKIKKWCPLGVSVRMLHCFFCYHVLTEWRYSEIPECYEGSHCKNGWRRRVERARMSLLVTLASALSLAH